MSRNALYAVIGVLAAGTVALGYYLYQERQRSSGIEINVDKSGISINKK